MARGDDLVSHDDVVQILGEASSAAAASLDRYPYELAKKGILVDTRAGKRLPRSVPRYTRSSLDKYLQSSRILRARSGRREQARARQEDRERDSLGAELELIVRLAQQRDELAKERANFKAELHRQVEEKLELQAQLEHLKVDADAAESSVAQGEADFEALYNYVIYKFGPQGPNDMKT